MKKIKVYGKAEVWVYNTVEVDDNANIEDIIDKAQQEFGGIHTYVGNGGMDKLIGVSNDDEGIEFSEGEIEFAPNGEQDIQTMEDE